MGEGASEIQRFVCQKWPKIVSLYKIQFSLKEFFDGPRGGGGGRVVPEGGVGRGGEGLVRSGISGGAPGWGLCIGPPEAIAPGNHPAGFSPMPEFSCFVSVGVVPCSLWSCSPGWRHCSPCIPSSAPSLPSWDGPSLCLGPSPPGAVLRSESFENLLLRSPRTEGPFVRSPCSPGRRCCSVLMPLLGSRALPPAD